MRFSINHTHAAQVMFSSISAASFTQSSVARTKVCCTSARSNSCNSAATVVLTKLRHGRRGSVAVVVGESGVRDRLRHCTTSWAAHWPLCAIDLCDITYAERHWQTAVKAVARGYWVLNGQFDHGCAILARSELRRGHAWAVLRAPTRSRQDS